MCSSANRGSKGLSQHIIKWSVSWKIFYFLGDTMGIRKGAVDSVRGGWCKFRDLVPLLASRDLPLGARGRYS